MLSLCLDGGGARGALEAAAVAALDDSTSFLLEVEAFAGTSIGSFIAAALAFGASPHDLLTAFEEEGVRIFERSAWRSWTNPFAATRSKYDNKNLYKLVRYFFGDKVFGDLQDKHLLVPTFGLSEPHRNGKHARPKIYCNFGEKAALDKSVTEAVMESMAAPVYFPVVNNTIDGGVFANNPSMSLLSELVRSGQHLDDIWMLSFGTGANPLCLDLGNKSWGLMDWVLKGGLISILMGEATTGANHYYVETILGMQYLRIQPYLDEPIEMDQCDGILHMVRAGLGLPMDDALIFMERYRKSVAFMQEKAKTDPTWTNFLGKKIPS
jgi:hypothetical protein